MFYTICISKVNSKNAGEKSPARIKFKGERVKGGSMKAKYMFLRKGGKAIHLLGDISRDYYDAELIIVYEETDTDYIGNFAEGFGFINVKFAKNDCRNATEDEVKLCFQGKMGTIKF